MRSDTREEELSVESRSFVNRANDQVRKRQKRISNVAGEGKEHSIIWCMCMAVSFMGKNFQNNCQSIVNTTDLTLKQMFDISAKLVIDQDEISNLETIDWVKHSWKYLSIIEESSIFNARRSTSSQILCCVLQRSINIQSPTKLGRKGVNGSRLLKDTETLMTSVESRLNSSGTSSQDSQRCSSAVKSMIYWATWDKHQKLSQEEFFMSMINDISCDRNDNKDECLKNAQLCEDIWEKIWYWTMVIHWTRFWKRSGILPRTSPQGAWDNIAEQMLLEFAKSGLPIFRATTHCPSVSPKAKGEKKLSIHFTADQDTIDTIYRIILSVNQLSIYGAVAAICDEYESHQDSTGQPVILVGQSIVLGEIKAEVPVHDEEPRDDQIIWQQYIQQVESLSSENRVSKFCKEAGFMRVVEVGQYFVTKDTGDFRQFQ